MLRVLTSFSLIAFFGVASVIGVWQYRKHTAEQRRIAELEAQKLQLEQQKQQLEQIVQRLTAEKRVAEILVTERSVGQDGTPTTGLLFVEYARDGSTLPPKAFIVRGEHVHIDGMVIEFEGQHVRDGDPLRGHSIILFDKIYGSADSPDTAYRIDTPGRIPDLYAGAQPEVSRFEQDLWADFWRLARDEDYRRAKGVRVANGKSVYGPFLPDRLYTLTLDAGGRMSRVDEPLKGAIGEALRRRSLTRE